MRIVDKRKFARSMSITITLVIFIILILVNTSFSHVETRYKEVAISSGDTLWNIAKSEQSNNLYFENKDIRDIVYEIKNLNNLDTSNLIIGEKIIVPTM